MQFHEEPLLREELIVKYLLKRLEANEIEAFESHYLICDECFEELRVTHLLMAGLEKCRIDRRQLGDVAMLRFTGPAQLTRSSVELRELSHNVLEQPDTKVLIDLSRVSRIDSAGLGLLMSCYSHTIRNQGMLKLLNPSTEVRKLLRLTKVESLLEVYQDENAALRSFGEG